MKKYRVTLTSDEREQLTGLIAAGKAAAQKLTHARILLKADQAEGGPGWIDEQIGKTGNVFGNHRRRPQRAQVEGQIGMLPRHLFDVGQLPASLPFDQVGDELSKTLIPGR